MENKKKESDKKEKEKAEYAEGLKKTLTPLLFGVLAGVICFLIFVSTPYLVSTNRSLKEDLDNGIVPENLITMFETKGIPLSENITITKEGNDKWWIDEEKYLFSTDIGFEDDLNNHTVSEALKNVFKTEGFLLSENSEKINVTKNEDKWVITDEEKKKAYFVRKKAEKLNVYEEKKNTYFIRKKAEKLNIYTTLSLKWGDGGDNWLLIAILMVLVQKFVYPFLHTSIKGAKDWIYISFMTIFCWFIFFALLLMSFF
jgi:hypothetical protein